MVRVPDKTGVMVNGGGDPGATDELHEEAARRLRAHDQRYTRSRRGLVDVLAAADAPLSIPQLRDHDRSLAQSSAYRNLAVLERAGVVHRIVAADDFARYELAEDLTGRSGASPESTASRPTTTGSTSWEPAPRAADAGGHPGRVTASSPTDGPGH